MLISYFYPLEKEIIYINPPSGPQYRTRSIVMSSNCGAVPAKASTSFFTSAQMSAGMASLWLTAMTANRRITRLFIGQLI